MYHPAVFRSYCVMCVDSVCPEAYSTGYHPYCPMYFCQVHTNIGYTFVLIAWYEEYNQICIQSTYCNKGHLIYLASWITFHPGWLKYLHFVTNMSLYKWINACRYNFTISISIKLEQLEHLCSEIPPAAPKTSVKSWKVWKNVEDCCFMWIMWL